MPAAIGIVYVAWDWAGPSRRLAPAAPACVVRSGLITLAVMGVLSFVSGLGWGWIANLGTPGTVRSWMAPATAVGLLISGSAHVVGIGVGLGGVLTLTRAIGLVAAAAVAVYCLRHRERIGVLGALGITMMAFVLLGPVVQPWYLTWGIIIVAPVVTGRMLYAVLGLSMVAPFIGLTGGADLLNELVHTDPASMVLAVMVLWAVAIVPLGNWTTSWRIDRSRLPALPGPPRPERRRSSPDPARPTARRPGMLEQALELDHVEPLAVLAPDLPLDADQLEAGRPVQPDGGLVVPGDAGDDRVEAVGRGQDQELGQQGPSPPPCLAGPGRRRPSSRRWPSTPSARGRARASRSRARSRRWPRPAPSTPEPGGSVATTRRVDAAVPEDPGLLLGPGAGHHVEGVGAVEHLDVVDGPDGLGVGHLGQSDPHRPMVLLTCRNRGSGGSPCRALAIIDRSRKVRRGAPLAQSAEHSHGKAGVVGSIPTGGSPMAA